MEQFYLFLSYKPKDQWTNLHQHWEKAWKGEKEDVV